MAFQELPLSRDSCSPAPGSTAPPEPTTGTAARTLCPEPTTGTADLYHCGEAMPRSVIWLQCYSSVIACLLVPMLFAACSQEDDVDTSVAEKLDRFLLRQLSTSTSTRRRFIASASVHASFPRMAIKRRRFTCFERGHQGTPPSPCPTWRRRTDCTEALEDTG